MATNIQNLNVYIQDNGTVTPGYDVLSVDLNCTNGIAKKVGIALFDISDPMVPLRVYAESPRTKFFTIIFNCDDTYTIVTNDVNEVRNMLVYDCDLCTTKTLSDIVQENGYNYYAQWTDFNLVAGDNVFDITDLSASISNWKSGYVAISAEMLANSVTVNENPNNIGYSIKIVSDTQFIVNAVAPITATITVQSVLKKAVSYNFDLEMDWSILKDVNGASYPVTDQATFEQWLTNGFDSGVEMQNDFTNIVITDFKMTGNRIQCNLTADASTFALCNNTIVNADKIGIINGLQYLYLYNNQITSFKPTIVLPSSLQILSLQNNQITTASYTAMEAWATAQPSFTNTCNVYFSNNIDSVSGTNLEAILISKNCNVIA